LAHAWSTSGGWSTYRQPLLDPPQNPLDLGPRESNPVAWPGRRRDFGRRDSLDDNQTLIDPTVYSLVGYAAKFGQLLNFGVLFELYRGIHDGMINEPANEINSYF